MYCIFEKIVNLTNLHMRILFDMIASQKKAANSALLLLSSVYTAIAASYIVFVSIIQITIILQQYIVSYISI